MVRANPFNRTKTARAGFTLIELVVVVSIVAVLAGLLLERMLFYQEQAEKVAMEQTIGSVRSALHLQFASLIAKNKAHEIPLLLQGNPMDWLAEKPKNYLGEYFAPEPQDVTAGYWYFDLQKRNLIYLIRSKAHFRSSGAEQDRVRFEVKLVRSSSTGEGQSESNIEGVILDPVVPYTWF